MALARALVLKPKIMLFDEPLSNLDPKLRIQTRSEIKRVQQMLGITTIYVTHDQTEALSLSDRVAVMNHGKIAQLGPPEEVYNHPASPFVSDFIGNANFLDAVVDEVTAGHMVVLINGFSFSVPLDRCEPNLEPDARALVSVKPEAIELVPPAAVAQAFHAGPRGVVELSSFSGPATEYKVTFGDAYLTVSTPNIRGRTVVYRAGSEVGLEFDPSSFRVYPA
ncbi:MAG: ABC transporter ATP-binding protein [Spirochaetaceae bacterium]|nr:MAG: ABC transporter ATP-binding protein [Spirochaetaceae bacterium]